MESEQGSSQLADEGRRAKIKWVIRPMEIQQEASAVAEDQSNSKWEVHPNKRGFTLHARATGRAPWPSGTRVRDPLFTGDRLAISNDISSAQVRDFSGRVWVVSPTRNGITIYAAGRNPSAAFISEWRIQATRMGLQIKARAGQQPPRAIGGHSWKLKSGHPSRQRWEIRPAEEGLSIKSNADDTWYVEADGPPQQTIAMFPFQGWFVLPQKEEEEEEPREMYTGGWPDPAPKPWPPERTSPPNSPVWITRMWPVIKACNAKMVVRNGLTYPPGDNFPRQWYWESEINLTKARNPGKDEDGVLKEVRGRYEPYLNCLLLCWDPVKQKSYQTYDLEKMPPKCWPRMLDFRPYSQPREFPPWLPAIPGRDELGKINLNMIYNTLRGHSGIFLENCNPN